MSMYAGTFIGNYVKNMAFKKHKSGPSKSQMEEKMVQDFARFYNPV